MTCSSCYDAVNLPGRANVLEKYGDQCMVSPIAVFGTRCSEWPVMTVTIMKQASNIHALSFCLDRTNVSFFVSPSHLRWLGMIQEHLVVVITTILYMYGRGVPPAIE